MAMEISSAQWYSEMEIEDSIFFHHCQMDISDFSLDDLDFESFPLHQENPTISNPKTMQSTHNLHDINERPVKQMKANSWESCTPVMNKPFPSSSSSQLISFESKSSAAFECMNVSSVIDMNQCDDSLNCGQKAKRKNASVTRIPLLAKEHVIAERKRREKLNQKFIALSSLLPGLKKADKATVLGEAIKHLKQLQEQMRKLEEEQESMKGIESMIFVKKSHIYIDEDASSFSYSSSSSSNDEDGSLPQIEARVLKNDVLVRIHCKKNKGCLMNILRKMEKLRLNVINSVVLPFGNSTLVITVRAKMDENFCMPLKDLVKNLRLAMLQPLVDF